MDTVKVSGTNNKHHVFMYAISTCGWCKKAKKFLKENNVQFEYVDIDLCNEKDKQKIRDDIKARGGSLVYPTLIIDNKTLFNGAPQDKLRVVLEI